MSREAKKPINFHIVTLFPEAFESYLKSSILGRAIEQKLIKIKFYHPRDYVKDKHRVIDDRPYAGGAGMVMMAMPVVKAVEDILRKHKSGKTKIVMLAVAGKQFTNAMAIKWSGLNHVVFISGRYEGIDARTIKIIKDIARKKKNVSVVEVSIGPYIVMGGELPALSMIDSVSRHIEGVLGKQHSREEVRFKEIVKNLGRSITDKRAKTPSLESYTRPPVIKFKGKIYKVPPILTTGDHKKIAAWRAKKMKFV